MTTPRGEDRRAAILAALEECLAEAPFVDVQIADIARRAGVTRPGFYFYFPTKAAAVSALLEGLFVELTTAAEPWYEGREDESSEGRLREAMAGTVELWHEHASLLAAMVDGIAVDAEARVIWDHWIEGFVLRTAKRIEEDARPTEVTSLALASLLIGMVVDAMSREVRSVLDTGKGQAGIVDGLVYVWLRTIYGVG